MAGPPCNQSLETQADLPPQVKVRLLSGQQPGASIRILRTIRICDL